MGDPSSSLPCLCSVRLQSTIVGAGLKLGPVRLPLPLTGRVGYLEFIYQDEDIRVTRGNRYTAVSPKCFHLGLFHIMYLRISSLL